jgi:hypothetical protein
MIFFQIEEINSQPKDPSIIDVSTLNSQAMKEQKWSTTMTHGPIPNIKKKNGYNIIVQ